MFTIHIPISYEAERRYIIHVIFSEFLGLDYHLRISDRPDVKIENQDAKQLLIADGLFSVCESAWLHASSLPHQPLRTLNFRNLPISPVNIRQDIPVIYGVDPDNPGFFQVSENCISLGLDIFGSAFFMLTRYEEVIKADRDIHDRFPAVASLAFQENFLDRPVINEYVEILWYCLKWLWPALERMDRSFQIYVSHDVDVPFKYRLGGSSRRFTRTCAEEAIKRKNPIGVLHTIQEWASAMGGNLEADPYNTFDRLMDISEECNLRSAFYFITDHPKGSISGRYDICHPYIRHLLHKVYERGHEIGLHPSYTTYQDPVQTQKEFGILKNVCDQEGIQQNIWGGRQHFLRCEIPTTFQNWEDAGLSYDSTLAFADHAGFRCGVCHEFPVFNVVTRKVLNLRERPLVIMESTLIDKQYMNLGAQPEALFQIMKQYRDCCRMFNGDFTLLWHNSRFDDNWCYEVYTNILAGH